MCYNFMFDFWCASKERCDFPQLKIYLERGVCNYCLHMDRLSTKLMHISRRN